MEILLGHSAGFCAGVKNAIQKTEQQLNIKGTNTLYSIGELVHNEEQIRILEEKGLTIAKDIEYVENNSTAIVRAHGVTPSVYEYAKEHNIQLIDLTCPNVVNIHNLVKANADNMGFTILIADRNHPETIGTLGFCGINVYLVESLEDVDTAITRFKNSTLSKLLIVAQTTFSSTQFDEIISDLKPKLPLYTNLTIQKTICDATEIRQSETALISKQVENMVIIGGKQSSNTKKLYELAKENCPNTFLIQTFLDLRNIKFKKGKVGIMTGASTPQFIIDEVVEKLRQM